MADDTAAAQHAKPNQPRILAKFIEKATPMGDLSQFAIDDLTPEEDEVFFRILEDS